MSTSNSNLNSFAITSTNVQVSLVPGQMFVIGCDQYGRVYMYPFQPVQQPVENSTTTTTAVTNTVPTGTVSNDAAVANSDEEEDEIPEAEYQEVQELLDGEEAMELIHEYVENRELLNEGGVQEDDVNVAKEDLAEKNVMPLASIWNRQKPKHQQIQVLKNQREQDRKNKVKKTPEEERSSKRDYFRIYDSWIDDVKEYLKILPNLRPAIENVKRLDPEFDIDEFIHELEPREPGFAKVSNYMQLCSDVEKTFREAVANDDKMRARASNMTNHTVSDYVAAQLGAESASNIVTTTSNVDTAPGRWRRARDARNARDNSWANVVGCGGGNN